MQELAERLVKAVNDGSFVGITTKLFMGLFFVLFCAFFFQYIQNLLGSKGRGWAIERARHLIDLNSVLHMALRTSLYPLPPYQDTI